MTPVRYITVLNLKFRDDGKIAIWFGFSIYYISILILQSKVLT